ncbi:MAG: OmpA family protein [Candidatus Saccharibacteria bacterium]|nr:OmpA family protein [Rhodoferax sp.]
MNTAIANAARFSGRLSLVAAAILGANLAQADYPSWYVGANAGQSMANIDDPRIVKGLLGSGFTSVIISESNRDTGYKVFGGYQFSNNFAIEGGYFDLGQFGFTATTVPVGTLNGNIKLRGVNVDLVGSVPLTQNFSVLGRVGANYAQARDTFTGTGAVVVLNPNPGAYDTQPKLGLGLQYALSESVAVRAEVERYRVNDAIGNRGDVDLVSVGLVYRFGGKTPQPVAYSPAPAPYFVAPAVAPLVVAPPPVIAPAPAPPAAVMVAPPMAQKVSFSADSLFDFDSAAVLPGGRQQLDRFASELRGVRYDVVNVTGHTDRLGAAAYNLKLSTRRAEAVRSYLITSGGVPADKISAKGVNGSDPITKMGDCPAKLARPALIRCLQPDRRVEIQVTGAR